MRTMAVSSVLMGADRNRITSATACNHRVWLQALGGEDRERAFAAAEVAMLLDLRRALRNGTVWIEHSLAFRSHETSFIPQRCAPSTTTLGTQQNLVVNRLAKICSVYPHLPQRGGWVHRINLRTFLGKL
jgi:hypothetical protein